MLHFHRAYYKIYYTLFYYVALSAIMLSDISFPALCFFFQGILTQNEEFDALVCVVMSTLVFGDVLLSCIACVCCRRGRGGWVVISVAGFGSSPLRMRRRRRRRLGRRVVDEGQVIFSLR